MVRAVGECVCVGGRGVDGALGWASLPDQFSGSGLAVRCRIVSCCSRRARQGRGERGSVAGRAPRLLRGALRRRALTRCHRAGSAPARPGEGPVVECRVEGAAVWRAPEADGWRPRARPRRVPATALRQRPAAGSCARSNAPCKSHLCDVALLRLLHEGFLLQHGSGPARSGSRGPYHVELVRGVI